ncbi:MAG: hypothetical protein QF921_08725 [Pseudomonadales bacterium]|jgi:hypothetical protein|nr:hypothetical protein [Pseudomonadales bacterium]MDP6471280.1 hypothetical protein [Pseudomonadales bacterium]MDP6825531.1 hypothetical protein [Pseudomonadales bacterium]MDP6971579.1 hypothetical protein [Pseudomonadales bacterium]|tara:strand:+ start:1570 stop:1824 length:255 start_codon:yes stop_codon:yes gene_type:complete
MTRYHAHQRDENGEGEGDFWVTGDGVLMKLDMTHSNRRGRVSNVESVLEGLAMGPQPECLFTVPANYNSIKTGGPLESLGSFGK